MNPPLIIGQRLNAAGSRSIAQALAWRDSGAIAEIARRQWEAGADYLDLCAAGMSDEPGDLEWLVQTVQGAVDVPLSLDTHDLDALRRALPLCRRLPCINSVSPGQSEALWTLLRDWAHCRVVVLCLDERGTSTTAAKRLEIATRLADRLLACGFPLPHILFDPLTLPARNGRDAQNATLQTMTALRERYPDSGILCAVGNYGYGLASPMRRLAERSYAQASLRAGANAFLCDPGDSELASLSSSKG